MIAWIVFGSWLLALIVVLLGVWNADIGRRLRP